MHTSFKLSQKGETLTLSHRTGEKIDSITYEGVESDVSVTTINGTTVYRSPTPNTINKMLYAKQLFSNLPTFSLKSGYYNTPHELTLTQDKKELFTTPQMVLSLLKSLQHIHNLYKSQHLPL